jgi:DNA-binding IclR family transcriptional regulator
VGSRFPARIRTTGRCIAAFGNYADTQLEASFKTLRWDDAPAFEAWQTQVAQTADQGFGADDGEYISGVTVFAVSVGKAAERPSHALFNSGIGSAL